MTDKKKQSRVTKGVYTINLTFFLYFVILFVERLYSLIRSATAGVFMFDNLHSGIVYTTTIASVTATVFFIAVFAHKIVFAPFVIDRKAHEINYTELSRIVGIQLVGGMMHTEYTLAPLQFCAYGALIIGMFVKTAISHKAATHKHLLWLSVIYLTAFSMAIPVMYSTEIANYIPYYIVEAITAIALVVCFTFMLEKVFTDKAQDLFYILPIALAIAGDAVIIALPWHEKINMFVLIVLCLSTALWIVGKTISFVIAHRNKAIVRK